MEDGAIKYGSMFKNARIGNLKVCWRREKSMAEIRVEVSGARWENTYKEKPEAQCKGVSGGIPHKQVSFSSKTSWSRVGDGSHYNNDFQPKEKWKATGITFSQCKQFASYVVGNNIKLRTVYHRERIKAKCCHCGIYSPTRDRHMKQNVTLQSDGWEQ